MLYTEHTELEGGKFYYCVGVNSVAYISTFSDLPGPDDRYNSFKYRDYWTPKSGFTESTDTCCFDDIADMQHYLLPDVNSAEDVEHYIKSHPELVL
jgi:hypothetical protein